MEQNPNTLVRLDVELKVAGASPTDLHTRFKAALRDAILVAYNEERIELQVAEELWRCIASDEERT
jgi:hypothetical protein